MKVTLQTLRAALRLETFTLQELAHSAGTSEPSAETVLRRHPGLIRISKKKRYTGGRGAPRRVFKLTGVGRRRITNLLEGFSESRVPLVLRSAINFALAASGGDAHEMRRRADRSTEAVPQEEREVEPTKTALDAYRIIRRVYDENLDRERAIEAHAAALVAFEKLTELGEAELAGRVLFGVVSSPCLRELISATPPAFYVKVDEPEEAITSDYALPPGEVGIAREREAFVFGQFAARSGVSTAYAISATPTEHAEIVRGASESAGAVSVTLGPRGRNIVIEKSWGTPTDDVDRRLRSVGAQMVRQVSARTTEVTGDGGTTTTILAQSIYSESVKAVKRGASPQAVVQGIDVAVSTVVAALRKLSRPVSDLSALAQIGSSTSAEPAIGSVVAEAMSRVGIQGEIIVERGSEDLALQILAGISIDRGYISPYFVTDQDRMEARLENCAVAICADRLSTMPTLLPLLEAIAARATSILLVAEDVVEEALAMLVVNKLRGRLAVCAVRAPAGNRRDERLEDLAIATGATIVTASELEISSLGHARRVIVDKDTTRIVAAAEAAKPIRSRIKALSDQAASTTSDYEREKLHERLDRMRGIAVIQVGEMDDADVERRQHRVEDAIRAIRSASEEGVVPGGGVALLRCRAPLEALHLDGDQQHGVYAVHRALEQPLRQLAQNSGIDDEEVVARVAAAPAGIGYNVTANRYEDLAAAGIVDPTKVVRIALENAASMASILLRAEAKVQPTTRSVTEES